MGWKHYQTVDHPKWEPQVGSGLFGIRLLILHFKFQFSKYIKSSTFHIFPNLTYPLRKIISFPKFPKIIQKFTQNGQTVVNEITIEISRCLKHDRDVGRKAVISDVKTAFTCTPAIIFSLWFTIPLPPPMNRHEFSSNICFVLSSLACDNKARSRFFRVFIKYDIEEIHAMIQKPLSLIRRAWKEYPVCELFHLMVFWTYSLLQQLLRQYAMAMVQILTVQKK